VPHEIGLYLERFRPGAGENYKLCFARKVAVAFNSLPADDPKALNGVTQLTNEIGLEAVDTGNLSSATVC